MNSLETQVLRLIGEDVSTPDVFTDDDAGMEQIRKSINDAIQELCMVTGSYQRIYHLPLFENRQFYRLAPLIDHVGYVAEAWDRSNHQRIIQTDLTALSSSDRWWMQRNGPVTHFAMIGLNHVGVYMIPSSKGTILELKCVCIPAEYSTDKDPIKLREAYQRATVSYACSEYYASRGDASRATEYMNKYLELTGLMGLHPQTAERQFQYGGFNQWNRGQWIGNPAGSGQ